MRDLKKQKNQEQKPANMRNHQGPNIKYNLILH